MGLTKSKLKQGSVPNKKSPVLELEKNGTIDSATDKTNNNRRNANTDKKTQAVQSVCKNSSMAFKHRIGRHRDGFDQRITAKYEIRALIGKGSFSRVVRVENKLTKELFALKVIDLRQDSRFCENELSILSKVRHQNVIRMVESVRSPQRLYMIIELATGGDLFDRIITRAFLPEIETVKILKMVLEGLSYLHHLGITHRDLKPENILYAHPGYDSKILISDFGLAHQCTQGDNELMATTCGTPEYIAPEVLLRQPYSNKVDIWAVGVVCYIMLSGTMPFDDDNRNRIYRAILKAKYDFPEDFWSDVSSDAKSYVNYLLDPDPDRRPTAHQCLDHFWVTKTVPSLQPRSRSLHKSYSHQPKNAPYRTRSSRSNRSIARSDAGRRVNADELDRLSKDPEFQRIMKKYSNKHLHRDINQQSFGFTAKVLAVV